MTDEELIWSQAREMTIKICLCVLSAKMFENPDVSELLSLHQFKMPLYTKIQNLEEEIAILHHKKLISKNWKQLKCH